MIGPLSRPRNPNLQSGSDLLLPKIKGPQGSGRVPKGIASLLRTMRQSPRRGSPAQSQFSFSAPSVLSVSSLWRSSGPSESCPSRQSCPIPPSFRPYTANPTIPPDPSDPFRPLDPFTFPPPSKTPKKPTTMTNHDIPQLPRLSNLHLDPAEAPCQISIISTNSARLHGPSTQAGSIMANGFEIPRSLCPG